jgi:hypothetical protein
MRYPSFQALLRLSKSKLLDQPLSVEELFGLFPYWALKELLWLVTYHLVVIIV